MGLLLILEDEVGGGRLARPWKKRRERGEGVKRCGDRQPWCFLLVILCWRLARFGVWCQFFEKSLDPLPLASNLFSCQLYLSTKSRLLYSIDQWSNSCIFKTNWCQRKVIDENSCIYPVIVSFDSMIEFLRTHALRSAATMSTIQSWAVVFEKIWQALVENNSLLTKIPFVNFSL